MRSWAQSVLDLAMSRSPTLADARLVCVDGPSGGGKSTLAHALGAPVVRMDDLYDGWTGLQAGVENAAALVAAFAGGRSARYRRYDWARADYDGWVDVPPTDLLVLEGCGSGSASYAPHITVLVWVEAPPDVCLARAVQRDGEELRDQLVAWQRDEAELFARERTRERADFVFVT